MDSVKASISSFSVRVRIGFITGNLSRQLHFGTNDRMEGRGDRDIRPHRADYGLGAAEWIHHFQTGVTLDLHAPTQTVTLKSVGDPAVDGRVLVHLPQHGGRVAKSAVASALQLRIRAGQYYLRQYPNEIQCRSQIVR